MRKSSNESLDNKVGKQTVIAFHYVFGSNLLLFLAGIIKSWILPKYWSIDAFGYWQIYVFYLGYAGLFLFGFNDGIYLRYGRYQYDQLPLGKLSSAIKISLSLLFLQAVSIVLFSSYFLVGERRFIFMSLGASVVIAGINGIFIYVLQATNQLKKYGICLIIDRILLLFGILVLLFINRKEFQYLVFLDIASKLFSMCYISYLCKDLLFNRSFHLWEGLKEYQVNVSSGINLMFAAIMGMLIVGGSRLMVEYWGNIQEYAYYAFGISLMGFIFLFIGSGSSVLYPTLHRLDAKNRQSNFRNIENFLNLANLLILAFYFCLFFIINYFMIKYRPTLVYLNILFIITALQAKQAILNNTFLKYLRKERIMLLISCFSVVAFFLIVFPFFFFFNREVFVVALCTMVVFYLQYTYSSLYLYRLLELKSFKPFIRESAVLLFFLLLTLNKDWINWAMVICTVYLCYRFYKERQTLVMIKNILILRDMK